MSKISVILVLSATTALSVACKRKHNCICTTHYNGADTTWQALHGDTIFKESKENARTLCDALEGDIQTILTETYYLECQLEKDIE